jgi:hypothetical protein
MFSVYWALRGAIVDTPPRLPQPPARPTMRENFKNKIVRNGNFNKIVEMLKFLL